MRIHSQSFEDIFRDLVSRHPTLSVIRQDSARAFEVLKRTFESGGKILVCGNGGSASDSDHIVGELVKSFAFHRPIPPVDVERLRSVCPERFIEFSEKLEGALPAISLINTVALNSAFANDVDYQFALAQQVYALAREEDALIGITTSGNSENVVNAAITAKAKGAAVIGLTGATGGRLKDYCDVCIRAPARTVHVVQEHHLPIYHMLCLSLEAHFFGQFGMKTSKNEGDAQNIARDPLDRQIELLVFDFDGVFTDNKVYTNHVGDEFVRCDRGDGLGIDFLRDVGMRMLILSTERNRVVEARSRKLRLECHQGCKDKLSFLQDYLHRFSISADKVAYVGNDLNDLEAMKYVGIAICPRDAHHEVRSISDIVLSQPGGHGAIREISDLIRRPLHHAELGVAQDRL